MQCIITEQNYLLPLMTLISHAIIMNIKSPLLTWIATFRNQIDQIRSVAQSCPTLCNPMTRSTPGLPVHHQFPEFTQTHIHRVSDAIQPSHPLSSPSSPSPNPSQHQSLFEWVSSSHEMAEVLEFQLSNHSSQRNPRTDLQNGLVGSPCSPRDSQESSPTLQLKTINSSELSVLPPLQHARPPCPSPVPGACLNSYVQLSHPYMTTGKTIALTRRTFVGKVMSLLFNMMSRLV